MIWYLLYPLRGTTKPPTLEPKHPLRYFFTRYGREASQHPVITLLISVTVATILVYPFPFLYTNNFTNGASNLPHHVWTSAQPYDGDLAVSPDVVMRSIWVHGSYMRALKPNVLQTALQLQDAVLGPTINFNPRNPPEFDGSSTTDFASPSIRDQFHAINGVSNSSWFFHSPLQYWDCDGQKIAEDQDIIGTVNANSERTTSVNVTLRHSIVFSGKRFEDHRLVAADAIVITLIHMKDSPVGEWWERNAEQLRHGKGSWELYPVDGRSLSSTLYEFRFQPVSLQDDILLGIAYTLTMVYLILSLTRMRALKSRFGLLCAVASQIGVSIMSSFTICAILKIDLSKIPREAYPLVVLSVGLENIFRLINAVIMTPPEVPTTSRIAEALGNTGHIALAGVSQNLAILWMLSKVVSPGVRSFCTFAAIAITFDLFYMMTFFVAVLTIDVRRLELSDSLSRTPSPTPRLAASDNVKTGWTEALLKDDAPISTRVAGTVVMISFILTAQWHFFDNESFLQTASRFTRLLNSTSQRSRYNASSLPSINVNQARTPTAWLKLQDHETAHEVIKIVKPHAYSYVARVYDPLVFVLNGSDRTPTKHGIRPFLPAVYDFARHQSTLFIIVVVMAITGVSLLMNYLLWDKNREGSNDDRPEDEPLLISKNLAGGHTLDVVIMATSDDGILASAGLDRQIRIWDLQRGGANYIVHDPEQLIDPFPVWKMAIDTDSNWLAILSADRVLLWNIPEQRWGPAMRVALSYRVPKAFFFGHSPTELIDPIIVVHQSGWMSELHIEGNEVQELQICRTPLVCVSPYSEQGGTQLKDSPSFRIITTSRRGCVHVASLTDTMEWVSDEILCPQSFDNRDVLSVLPLPSLSSFLAVREQMVDLIDISTHNITHSFPVDSMLPNTLRCFHSTRRRPQCGSVGLAYLALAYTGRNGGNCVLQVYLPRREGDTICFRDPESPGSKTCCLWKDTAEKKYEIENPGTWDALKAPYVVGVRKIGAPVAGETVESVTGLRRRGKLQHRSEHRQHEEESWEVWCLSMYGEEINMPLNRNEITQDFLLVDDLGPFVTLGNRSIALGLGNVIKVITVGSERFDKSENNNENTRFVGMTASRRKKAHLAKRLY
ncbi:sterol-sensing domain of SREBP cleavage-activation-domain-containing protein [Calycina marina]|uniref:Sterol regulatory element-binding protein cleavage-activating protein n=1 Tax=Calycina marina TaxID=1763456 RepID=A0A9P7ZA95_9HELO|nr:sterol-sensing domain of SREBP cleavage-activation-domain-containing protein [Calycina marina]